MSTYFRWPRRLPGPGSSALLSALLSLALSAGVAQAADFPRYKIAACCQLCPQASDPASYNTKFLNSFRTLVQGGDGWLFRSEVDLLMQFGITPEGLQRLLRFRDALRSRGTELVVMVQPPRGLMHADKLKNSHTSYDPGLARASYLRLLHDLRSAGIVVPALEKLVQEKPSEDYFWRTDHHWTPMGTRRTAQLVAEAVRAMPQYAQVKKQKFVTRREGVLGRLGTLDNAAGRICGFGAARQYEPRFVTEPAGDEGGDLFGDDAAPQIVLIGTSNSGAIYNFAGFLSEFMEADVLNASVIGGGLDAAMLSYVVSEEFRTAPPKILVWELQHFHDLGDPVFHRQAQPILDDGCNGRPAILEREVTLRSGGTTEVLFNGGGTVRKLRGRDHVLDIQFSDPSMLVFRGVVWYTTGNKDTLRIEHSARASSLKGRFVTGLRDDGNYADQTFLGLDIELEPPQVEPGAPPPKPTGPVRVRARLCARADAPLSAAAPMAATARAAR